MIKRLCDNSTGGLLDTPLAPYLDAYTDFLTERRYAAHTVQFYLAGIAHFSRWASGCQLDIHQIDEDVTNRFLDDHLPHCDCPNPVHRVRKDLHAALGHLLVVLRARGAIAEPSVAMTPTDEELRRFDDYMNLARGLAPTTRCQCRRTVGRLLREQFGERPVVIAATKGRVMRYRPRLDEWKFSCEIEYDETLLTETQLRRIVDDTGSRVGLLDFRPARNGSFGRFVVVSWEAI